MAGADVRTVGQGEVAVDAQKEAVTDGIVAVEFAKIAVAVAGPTYFMLVDLSNSSGAYRHESTGSIHLVGFSAAINKSQSGGVWIVRLGTILAIDAVNVTIGFLDIGQLVNDSTNTFVAQQTTNLFPVSLSLKVVNGDYEKLAVNSKVTSTELTTASLIEDVSGGTVNPAVGDLLIRLERTSGGGDSDINYTAQYRTVK